jgi:hypothetical protein
MDAFAGPQVLSGICKLRGKDFLLDNKNISGKNNSMLSVIYIYNLVSALTG